MITIDISMDVNSTIDHKISIDKIEKHIPIAMNYYNLTEVPRITYIYDSRIATVARTSFEDISVDFNIANMNNKDNSVLVSNIIRYLTKEQCQLLRDNYDAFIVAHEFCHVKQMRTNKMYLNENKLKIIWAETGKEYRVPYNIVDYVNLPWEKEANIEANNYVQMVTNGR